MHAGLRALLQLWGLHAGVDEKSAETGMVEGSGLAAMVGSLWVWLRQTDGGYLCGSCGNAARAVRANAGWNAVEYVSEGDDEGDAPFSALSCR